MPAGRHLLQTNSGGGLATVGQDAAGVVGSAQTTEDQANADEADAAADDAFGGCCDVALRWGTALEDFMIQCICYDSPCKSIPCASCDQKCTRTLTLD